MADTIAVTPDGVEHKFLEGTDPAVIQRVIKQHIANVMKPPPPVNQNAINAAAVHPVGPTQSPSGYLYGNAQTPEELRNNIVDIVRTIGSPLAGAGAAVAAAPSAPFTLGAGPVAAGIAGYTALDTLLKQLKSDKKTTLGEDVKDSALEGTLNEVGGRLIGGVYKTGKALANAGIPDPQSILNLAPTAGQVLKSTGQHPWLAAIVNSLENTFAGGSKAAAQANSAELGVAKGMRMAAKEAGRSVGTVSNPNDMVKLITGELVPEERQLAGKIVERTADYQPIKVVPSETHFIDTSNGPSPFTQTRVTGPVEQVPVPGGYEILPGIIKKTPFATDPASLNALIADDVRLQDALTKSQAAGLGTNVRQDMAGFHLARIQQDATKIVNGVTTIDTDQVLTALSNPKMASSNKVLFRGSTGLDNMKEFYKTLGQTQGQVGGGSRILRYANTFGLPMSFLYSAMHGNAAGMGASAGMAVLELSAAGLAKLLTTQQSGRLMVALASGAPLGVSDQYAARMVMKSLSGTPNYLVDGKGNRTPVQVGANGELTGR